MDRDGPADTSGPSESMMSDPIRPSSHAHAAAALGDVSYLVYCLAQAAKLFLKMVAKRWPEAG